MNHYDSYDSYEQYEDRFNPLATDRHARRARKPKINHTPKKAEHEVLAELVDETAEMEGGFVTTYQPSRYEQGWLMESLRAFYQQELITDVLALVRGGKEASVYRCVAHPNTGHDLLAAKVYRPRQFRQLRNDKMYREGRGILTSEGEDVTQSIHSDRVMRAVGKKTDYGKQVMHTSWLMHEYTTLQRLHDLGAIVPEPVGASDNAILMTYCGDESMAAPPLQNVRLNRDEAGALFTQVIANIELMLKNGLVHGDLSAYNILYWDGDITIIDFPQVTDSHSNSSARFILQRDIERVCAYFAAQGIDSNPASITHNLWRQYAEPDAKQRAADLSRREVEDEDED